MAGIWARHIELFGLGAHARAWAVLACGVTLAASLLRGAAQTNPARTRSAADHRSGQFGGCSHWPPS